MTFFLVVGVLGMPLAFALGVAAAHSFFHLVQLLWRDPARTVRAVE